MMENYMDLIHYCSVCGNIYTMIDKKIPTCGFCKIPLIPIDGTSWPDFWKLSKEERETTEQKIFDKYIKDNPQFDPEKMEARIKADNTYTPPVSNTPSCPRCGSTSISANKEGFSVGKAVAGGVVAGGVGLLGGFIGSKKVRVTCLNCGNSWIAGK
jgi:hypothetical protein